MEIKNDAVIFGLLMLILAMIFVTSSSSNKYLKKFYTYVPPLLLCYFIPGFLNWPLNLVSPEESQLYFVASRYLLPASLVLFCLSIDLKGVLNLGPKALIMFLTATVGIVIGAPVALWLSALMFPEIKEALPGEEIWRGLSTIAGSWIGGGANQTAMKEIYNCSDSLFSSFIIIDVVVANIWMGVLLYGAGRYHQIDKRLKADNSSIDELKTRVETYRASIAKISSTTDLFVILAIGFGATAIAHLFADFIAPRMEMHHEFLTKYNLNSLTSGFFWLIVIATTIGLVLSFTKLKRYEGAGASRFGSIFIYVLVATIGMKMNLLEAFSNLHFFMIGVIWMIVHISILLLVAKLIKAPFFFVAVGSQANIGGAASAPIVASAFSTALAPVGVLLAVLGYALGTYAAIASTQLMQWTY
ncbi:DUF819 family protein [Prolixibacteraceae bacterium Z1-6]|uniref:DUF819 family protein n=1 Tax=Draconibacterium aestuarii TaxID=2998507 RepID=A0A9X3F894_9BACT|nr:DUF819 family protein [Prolixibacteraceae bacterium Z1-6]